MMATESQLLAHIAARSRDLAARHAPLVQVGPGDDCAVLRLGGETLLLTTDQLVEGRHYDASTPLDLVARKAVARSVSDIAAMGGTPTASLATAALRVGFDRENELFDAMARWAEQWGAPLVGGDIARVAGPTVLTTTVLGRPHARCGPVLRSTARAGDGVYVTGRLGGSFASGRHLTFEPRVRESAWLCDALGDRLHAMLDISDGLGRDAGRIALASSVRVALDASLLPCHNDADWRGALADGEDHELCFCAAGDVPAVCDRTGVSLTRVGDVLEGGGCVVRTPAGDTLDASELGWEHGS